MAEDEDEAAAAGVAPLGPFLKEYTPVGLPPVSAQKASVVFYRKGGYSVITVSGVRHVDKRALAQPRSVCEIAQGTYVSTLELDLPAAGGTSFFKAEVDIEWEVTDPYLAAVQVVTDVAKRLTSPVLERLREVTLTYRVTDAQQANRVITRECVGGRWSDLGSDLGLRVRLYVRLGVDDEAIGYAKKQREVRADAEVTKVRQDGFRRMLQGGELEQLSFMLAADPEGAKDFLEKIRQEGRQDERDRVDRLYSMALRGELNSIDVETQVLNLLNKDNRGLSGPIGSVPARREPRQLEASADGPYTPDWVSDEPPRRQPYRGESSRQESRRRDRYDDAGADEPPSRTRRRPDRFDPYPADDADREPPRGRASYRSDRAEPPDRSDRSDGYADDDFDWGPPRSRPYRPESYPVDDVDREPRGRAYRPERPDGYADDDFDREPPRSRPYRPELHPADDPDRDPPRGGRAHRPERYPADDDPDREPPRNRRRSRDDGWDWADEDR
ncbi:hypothetical protein AB0E10_11170 [Streptomyces sp. NPDC048045]|uniref:hypothetical protein n=1 Tax=Streptomyces sp. NPDC048045 TaxID=3154710 RepID=UPI0034200AA1